MKVWTQKEWERRGIELFGINMLEWKFVCPACKNIQCANDLKKFKVKGARPDDAYQRCIGRFQGGLKGPLNCDWASFGLFKGPEIVIRGVNKVEIPVFRFAEVSVGKA